MTKIYKTARGKSIDMDKVKLTNETAVAVGNMRVNARGDILGAGNQVVTGRNQIMDQIYAVPDTGYSPNSPESSARRQALIEASNAQKLAELSNNLTVPVTPTTDSEPATPPSTTRGSLASSVAKPTTVTQEPMPSPKEQKKSNGPGRI